MENQFRPQETPDQRLELLEHNCFKKEIMDIRRPFTTEELQSFKNEFADRSIVISEKEDELKKLTEPIKEEVKYLKKEANIVRDFIKNKYEEIEGEVYLFDDQQAGKMMYYDKNGFEIQSRPLLPHERSGQTRILLMNESKTA